MTGDELRPCPMCGSKRLKVYTTESVQSFRRGTVKCLDCGCTVTAEGGGFTLYREFGFVPDEKGRYSPVADEFVRKESNARARKHAIEKWNGDKVKAPAGEKSGSLMDMLARMCEAMRCDDCPLSIKGDASELVFDGGICELARYIVESMRGAE